MAEDIAFKPATELAALIRSRKLSPVEVMEACLARIEAVNPSLNAFVHIDAGRARQRAEDAEASLARGDAVGPLHGVPTALKDLFDFLPEWPATFGGIRSLKEHRVPGRCTYAERMEAAGAILVGKTNSPVMGFRGTCDNYLFGPTGNPFDPTKNAGGSSGGSAAAVAAGLVPLAEGTDGGGSIRIPAAWCNLVGYKASYGRIPNIGRPNGFSSTTPFLFEGALTTTVADAALALDVLSGYDVRDPFSVPTTETFSAALTDGIAGRRIGYSRDFGGYPVDPKVAAAVDHAVTAFEELGAVVEPIDVRLPYPHEMLTDLWCRLIMPANVEALLSLREQGVDLLVERRADLPPEYLRWIDEGMQLSAQDVARDQRMRTEVLDEIERHLDRYDFLVTPTVGALPVDNATDGNTMGPNQIAGRSVDPLIGWCLTYLLNFSGHPAVSVPAGLADGLPAGMQIVGRRFADADLIACAAAYETARPWDDYFRHGRL